MSVIEQAGWKKTTIGEAFETATGSTPPKSKNEYYGDFMPFVKPPELCNGEIASAVDNLSENGADVARVLPPDSLLISCIGNLGKIGLNTVAVAFNQQINAIKPAPDRAIPRFMFFQALSPDFKNQLQSLSSGTTVPIVNKSKFNSIAISLPPLPEQERIVAILNEAFVGIATATADAQRNLHNARELLQSVRQSTFEQKEDWVQTTIGEAFDTATGTTPPKSNALYYGNFMPFVKPPELRDAPLDSAMDNLSEAGADVARTLPPKSILVSCIGNLGKIGLNTVAVAFNQQINAILPDERKAIPKLMFHQALSSSFKEQLEALSGGTTVPIVNKSKFNSVTIVLPPMSEQKAIVSNLDDLTTKTRQLEAVYQRKLDALAELKQSLLQRAFAGELTPSQNAKERAIDMLKQALDGML